jgi:alpha-tubulin suppressor-like RCC1 family protein
MKTTQTLKIACLLCVIVLQVIASRGQTVTKISAGSNHSLLLKSDGSLWAMGDNNSGELGDGTTDNDNYNTNLPEQIVAGNVTAVAAGSGFSLFLKNDGSLWAMGDNGYGELGDGTYNQANLPEQIVAGNVTTIAAGSYHTLFLKSDGSLWAMGDNGDGQLGDGTTDHGFYKTNLPEQIVASNVTAIAGGSFHSLFLKNDGSLWAMGYNHSGQLGDGTTDHGFYSTNRPEQIVASNVTTIACGYFHSLFLKSDGSLWVMGDNESGQLGDGTYNNALSPEQIVASNVTAIAGGYFHTLFLKSDGSLWAMGDNSAGQLGDGFSNGTNQPEQIVASGVTAIAAGSFYSLFLKTDGSLWAMGDNTSGQLGDGTDNDQSPVPELILAPGTPTSIWLYGQLLDSGKMQFSFTGIAGTNYVLDRTYNLALPTWIPQLTNTAPVGGFVLMTNTPNKATNNFWRIRSAP